MKALKVRVTIAHPGDLSNEIELELQLNPRPTLSWVPREVVEQLCLPKLPRRKLKLSSGGVVERDIATAFIRLGGGLTFTSVAVAEPGDTPVLGMVDLANLGFCLDKATGRIVPQPFLAMEAPARISHSSNCP